MPRIRANCVTTFHNTVFNIRIVPEIHVVQNYGILYHTIVADKRFLKQDGILHRTIDYTSTCYNAVFNCCARVILRRGQIADFGINLRQLLDRKSVV